MAMKLYSDVEIKSIADAIRTKNGQTTTYKVSEMAAAIDAISGSGKEVVEWHQCPEAVRNYLANVVYDSADYSTSQITNYAPSTPVQSNTKPIGKTIDNIIYQNEIPNKETPFSSTNKAGTVKPLDALRWIEVGNDSQDNPFCPNMRDLGGWACDGGKIKYGLLYRCGQPTVYARDVLIDELGIQRELDLQGQDLTRITSVMGNDIEYCRPPYYQWYTIENKDVWKQIIQFLFNGAKYSRPTIFHCSAGADRTGTVACVIEALLGVGQSDVDKDYELTSFYSGTDTDLHARRRNESEWKGLINEIKAVTLPNGVADTFRNHAIYFVLSLGFTVDEINAFRSAMIDGTPETLTATLDSYSITNTLTNVVNDNDATTATEFQPYTAKITPSNGFVIENITVSMGGVDITPSAWSGDKQELYRAVSYTLSNCSVNNRRISVIDGQSYGTIITANDGYTLTGAAITITMGGVDVSTYYSNGTIVIPKVTGDIIITVNAVPSAPSFTNHADKVSEEWLTGKRINSSNAIVDAAGWDITNFVACGKNDTLRFKNIDVTSAIGGANDGRVAIYTDKNTCVMTCNPHSTAQAQFFSTGTDGTTTFNVSAYIDSIKGAVPAAENTAYIRLVCVSNPTDPIITINEEID